MGAGVAPAAAAASAGAAATVEDADGGGGGEAGRPAGVGAVESRRHKLDGPGSLGGAAKRARLLADPRRALPPPREARLVEDVRRRCRRHARDAGGGGGMRAHGGLGARACVQVERACAVLQALRKEDERVAAVCRELRQAGAAARELCGTHS